MHLQVARTLSVQYKIAGFCRSVFKASTWTSQNVAFTHYLIPNRYDSNEWKKWFSNSPSTVSAAGLSEKCQEQDFRTSGGTNVASLVFSKENESIDGNQCIHDCPPASDSDKTFDPDTNVLDSEFVSGQETEVKRAKNIEAIKQLLDEFEDSEEICRPTEGTKIEMLPRVMIVGRPNVGKSALFNRLTKRREALVYNTPDGHVTRDFREGVAKLADLRFRIFDTAGLEMEADPATVLVRTAEITSSVLCNCHLALFLLDGRAGLQPHDAEVGKWLRKYAPQVHVVLALNKAEGIHDDASGWLLSSLGEAHSLGFGEPVAISAETGEGLNDLYQILRPLLEQVAAEISAKELCREMVEEVDTNDHKRLELQLAIAGRPNVGKSTLLNALLRQERVLTGPEPGLTRDSVRVKFEHEGGTVYLVDTAGWMQRVQTKKGPAALSAMHARRSLMRANIVALLLDGEEIAKAKKTLRHSEAALARWVTQEGRGLVVVVNKMDVLKGKEHAELRNKVMKAVPEELNILLPQVMGVPIVFVSALEGKGCAAIMKKVFESYEKWNIRLPTARLNSWLQKVLNRHPRRGEGGYGPKMRYMTQVKARPPTFVVFVTGSGELEETDLRFLASALREDFNLDGIPIRILPRYAKRNLKGRQTSPVKTQEKAKSFCKSLGSQLPSLKRVAETVAQ